MEILQSKEYKTMGGFMRGVRATFSKVYGNDDLLTMIEDDDSVEEIILAGENATHNEGSVEYKLGWDIEYPNMIYAYYEDRE